MQQTTALLQQADAYKQQAVNLYHTGSPAVYAQVILTAWLEAVHRIDAYLYEHNWGLPSASAQRTAFVKRLNALRPLATAFLQLENDATLVHYNPSTPMSQAAAGNALANADAILQVIMPII